MIELLEPVTPEEQLQTILDSRLPLRDVIASSNEDTFELEFHHPLGPLVGIAQFGADEEVLAFCDLYGSWTSHEALLEWDPKLLMTSVIYPCIGRTFAGHPSIYPLARDQLAAYMQNATEEQRLKIASALSVFEPYATKVLADICH